MAPTVFGLDSAELTLGAYRLGIVHSPGYPIYLLIAHLFTQIPIGDVAFRVNLFSTISGALLVVAIAYLLSTLLENRLLAFSCAMAFAFVYYSWASSVVAEVYTSQGLLFAGILILALEWRRRRSDLILVVCAFLLGLSVANNVSTILWWPGFLLLLFINGSVPEQWEGRKVLALIGLTVGLLFILYIPIRSSMDPGFVYAGEYDLDGRFVPLDLTDPGNLFWYLSGGQFRELFPDFDIRSWADSGVRFLHQFWSAFLGVGVPLGLWGGWRLRKVNRQLLIGLIVIILPTIIFFLGYKAVDKEFMLLPFYIVWTLAIGFGMEALFQPFNRRSAALSFLLPLALLIINYSYVDLSGATRQRVIAASRLNAVEQQSYYLGQWGEASIMQYLQQVEEIRRDVRVVNIFFVDEDSLPILIKKVINRGHNVYLTRKDILIKGGASLQPVGHGYRITNQEQTE